MRWVISYIHHNELNDNRKRMVTNLFNDFEATDTTEDASAARKIQRRWRMNCIAVGKQSLLTAQAARQQKLEDIIGMVSVTPGRACHLGGAQCCFLRVTNENSSFHWDSLSANRQSAFGRAQSVNLRSHELTTSPERQIDIDDVHALNQSRWKFQFHCDSSSEFRIMDITGDLIVSVVNQGRNTYGRAVETVVVFFTVPLTRMLREKFDEKRGCFQIKKLFRLFPPGPDGCLKFENGIPQPGDNTFIEDEL